MKPSRLSAALLGLVLSTMSAGTHGIERGRSAEDRPYVSGGIAQDEAQSLQAERAASRAPYPARRRFNAGVPQPGARHRPRR